MRDNPLQLLERDQPVTLMAKTRQEQFAEWEHKKKLITEQLKANPDEDDQSICESLADKHADLKICEADVMTVRGPSFSRLLVFSALVISGFGLMAVGYFPAFFLVFPGSQLVLMKRKQLAQHYTSPMSPNAIRRSLLACFVVAFVMLVLLVIAIDSRGAREFLQKPEQSARYRLGTQTLLGVLAIWMLADTWFRWLGNRQKIAP